MIKVTLPISIGEHELEEYFIRSPGSGGQKVNKTERGAIAFQRSGNFALKNAGFVET